MATQLRGVPSVAPCARPRVRERRLRAGRRARRPRAASRDASSPERPLSIFGHEVEETPELAPPEAVEPSSGSVRGLEEGVVMIEGLPAEAPMGTHLQFEKGQQGVLLWRYTAEACFALLAEGTPPSVGDSVVCVQGAEVQFVVEGVGELRNCEPYRILTPQTQILEEGIFSLVAEKGEGMPLLNQELPMASRQSIYQPLSMQHRGVDVLTPIGRGQCILLVSEQSLELSELAGHMIKAQTGRSVPTVYACIGKSEAEFADTMERLSEAVHDTVLIKALDTEPLAQQYAALCAALSFGERVRDDGGDALVILDTVQPLSDVWNLMQRFYAATHRPAAAAMQDQLVEMDGTFMASKTAERRRFFSSVLQRASKASAELGGGSVTVVPVVRGLPASGTQRTELHAKLDAIEKDPKLSASLKAKLRKKLDPSTPSSAAPDKGTLPTFIVEELMSIADGQIVIKEIGKSGVSIDPLLSVSRIGARAYPGALETLAPAIRLELAQAADASQFGSRAAHVASASWNSKIETMQQALVQQSGDLCPLSHQVVMLLALKVLQEEDGSGKNVRTTLREILEKLKTLHPTVLQEIDTEQRLRPSTEQRILQIVQDWTSASSRGGRASV